MKIKWITIPLGMSLAFAANVILATPSGRPVAKVSPQTQWRQEPDGLLGISFSTPFPGDMPACPRSKYNLPDAEARAKLGVPCYQESWRPGSTGVMVFNLPALNFGYSLEIETSEGVPGRFRLQVSSSSYAAMRAVLVERYGAPHASHVGTVTTYTGEKLAAETMVWMGDNAMLGVEQIDADDIRTSTAILTTTAMMKARARKSEQGKADAASKL